jgi:hypothetical protein
MQRIVATALLVFFALGALAGCASDPADTGTTPPPDSGDPAGPSTRLPTGGALPEQALPFTDSEASFTTREGEGRDVVMRRTDVGARMTISTGATTLGHLEWRREGEQILLSDGPDRWVAMLKIGAQPGAVWTSSGRTIRFDGWERVQTPSGDYDAVRITSAATTKDLEESETWWFAPGVGLVKLSQNKGDLFQTEMWRTR